MDKGSIPGKLGLIRKPVTWLPPYKNTAFFCPLFLRVSSCEGFSFSGAAQRTKDPLVQLSVLVGDSFGPIIRVWTTSVEY